MFDDLCGAKNVFILKLLQHNLSPKIQQLCTTDMHNHRQQTLLEYVLEYHRPATFKAAALRHDLVLMALLLLHRHAGRSVRLAARKTVQAVRVVPRLLHCRFK